MAWFKRDKKSITTPTKEKKETPDGLWVKTSSGNIIESKELAKNFYVDPEGHHTRIGSKEYFDIIYDDAYYTEIHEKIASGDPLHFEDNKKYTDRITATQKKTGLVDACRSAYGKTSGQYIVVTCMDFTFIGGSMGSVVGEKIALAIDYAIKKKCPFMMISKSGGARMMEAGFSLMQMAKTSAKLTQLSQKKLPYISYLTDPTTGGVTASFAMLGDVNIAEPNALIGFAGPRVIKETIGMDLPEGFQTSEFLLEKGFLDYIVDRRELRPELERIIRLLQN
ncbi:MAG: acetyl-CoA carboxylase carboxyltransferase subunit beta [Crocinitomicaceae bacterium]|nr:acetyl-CoA carboxylase carboxyltransferase subunit beta [Crocinitomicaceae bacterium]MBT5401830.1 acetyl-CoA carboxylase carboxyltransferase subunit beta [Crocinitomicaceae bacterium]MBT6513687.1 acetyl-CoA carboxylase carboxyltransferase subunit beta [Crocinitomicaceae bacterium]